MKNNIRIAKTSLLYLKEKKVSSAIITFACITTLLSFIPMFISGSFNYSWIVILVVTIDLFVIIIYIFSTLFVDTKYNQFDLLLLAKTKNPKEVYISKWLISILYFNVFILFDSFLLAFIFSIYSNGDSLFVSIMFASLFMQNIISILFILFFSLLTLVISKRITIMSLALTTTFLIFSISIPIKVMNDSRINEKSDFVYNENKHYIYANVFHKSDKGFESKLIEKTNFKYKINNKSIRNNQINTDLYNPMNWLNSLQLNAISRQISGPQLIINSKFNINSNHFSLNSNLFKERPKMDDNFIYPIGIKPILILNKEEVEKQFEDLYHSLISKGYKNSSFNLVKDYIANNDFWENIDNVYKEVLFDSIGILGEEELMYMLRDKEMLFKKYPDIFQALSEKTTKEFSDMLEGIYKNDNSDFNIINIKAKNRNEMISTLTFNNDKKANSNDVEYFKYKLVQFVGNTVKIKDEMISLSEFQKVFKNIGNTAEWQKYIEENSFKLKDLKNVYTKLYKINYNLKAHVYKFNDSNLNEFHYEYNNNTTIGVTMPTITVSVFILLIILMLFLNVKKLSKANLKGF